MKTFIINTFYENKKRRSHVYESEKTYNTGWEKHSAWAEWFNTKIAKDNKAGAVAIVDGKVEKICGLVPDKYLTEEK